MRRLVPALALMLSLAVATGCAVSAREPASDEGGDPVREEAHSFETMPMYANEKTALEHMSAVVGDYLENATAQGWTEGEDYLDVAGITPTFVGYEIIVWEPIAHSEDVQYVELQYLNGHVARSLGEPETPIGSEQPRVLRFDKVNARPAPDLPSEGELAAVAAAEAAMSDLYPDTSAMQYGIQHYLFLYERDDRAVVIGVAIDGESAVNGKPVMLAK